MRKEYYNYVVKLPVLLHENENLNRMGILEFFDQYKCTKNEKEHLLDYLCTIRVKRVIKEINDLKINKKTV